MTALRLDKIMARLAKVPDEFDGLVAQVGIPAGRKYEDRGFGAVDVAYVAAIQEFGAPEVKIPARPFFRPTIAAKQKRWSKIIANLVPQVGEGKATAHEVLDAAGDAAAMDIKTTVSRLYSPALSPVTVLLRKWRKDGRRISGKTVGEAAKAIRAGVDPGGDDKPLNDTGLLYASILSTVNKAGAEFKA